jgi:hypothetical protein
LGLNLVVASRGRSTASQWSSLIAATDNAQTCETTLWKADNISVILILVVLNFMSPNQTVDGGSGEGLAISTVLKTIVA